MANNRLWLVDIASGERVLLAKYYPAGGWLTFHDKLGSKLDDLFKATDTFDESKLDMGGFPQSSRGQWGGNPFRFEYDMDDEGAKLSEDMGGFPQSSRGLSDNIAKPVIEPIEGDVHGTENPFAWIDWTGTTTVSDCIISDHSLKL